MGLALILLIWLSTALVQSPLHGRLAGGCNAARHARLVTTNTWRTAAWLVRGALVAWWLVGALAQSGPPA